MPGAIGVPARVVVGRERVVREIRAAAPLMADLAAPIPARAPWLTAALYAGTGRRAASRPVAVVVDDPRGHPAALALLTVRRDGLRATVTLLGQDAGALPDGRPAARLLARDAVRAALLADGIVAVLAAVRGRWRLRLSGLPLGDPVAAALAARLPTSVLANARSRVLVDDLGPADRSRDPRALERVLPGVLAAEPHPRSRALLRAASRLHVVLGQVEVAVLVDPHGPRTALLSLVDGADRWPWRAARCDGPGDAAPVTAMGAPLSGLTAAGWSRGGAISRRYAPR